METKELLAVLKELFPGVSIRVTRCTKCKWVEPNRMKQGLLFPNPQELTVIVEDDEAWEPVD